MSVQRAFFIAGIAFFAAAVVLAAIAAYVFFSRDIRAVMDDLSGKTRERNIGQDRSRRRRRSVVSENAHNRAVNLGQVGPERNGDDEPLVTEVTFDMDDGTDDMPTVVTSVDAYYSKGYAQVGDGAGMSQERNAIIHGPIDATPSFLVTKRIVLTHSDGVITAS